MQTNSEDTVKVKSKLKFWSQELHDMSGRNRLLFYKDTKTSTADIELPGFISLFNLLVEQAGNFMRLYPMQKKDCPYLTFQMKMMMPRSQIEVEGSAEAKRPRNPN